MKPYVAHITPKVNEQEVVPRRVSIDEALLKDIEKQIENAPKGSLVAAGSMDPLSEVATSVKGGRTARSFSAKR